MAIKLPPKVHNETIPKCRYAEKPCATSIFTKRKRLIVSIPMVSKLSTLFGGDEGDRTLDLLNAIQTRSQLRYAPEFTKILYYRPPEISRAYPVEYVKSFSGLLISLTNLQEKALKLKIKCDKMAVVVFINRKESSKWKLQQKKALI